MVLHNVHIFIIVDVVFFKKKKKKTSRLITNRVFFFFVPLLSVFFDLELDFLGAGGSVGGSPV